MTSNASVGVGQAADALGVTTQTIRNWIGSNKLKASKGRNGRWQVDAASLRDCAQALDAAGNVRRTASAESNEIALKLDRLSGEVTAMMEADRSSERLLAAVERERDGYRADAASVREAALQLVAAADDTYQAVATLLKIMARQRDALSQLLAPGSPRDLMPRP